MLRLSHFVTDAAAAIDNCYVVGLHTSLARLEPCLAGHPVAWDWDGFAEAQAHYAALGLAPPLRRVVTIDSSSLRVQNFGVSSDGFGAGEGQSLERPFGHANPAELHVVGRRHRELGQPHRTRRHPRPRRLLHPRLRHATSAPRSWAATSSARSADRGRTTTGRAGGATTPPFHTPVFVLTHHVRPVVHARRHHVPLHRRRHPPTRCAQAQEAADGKDVRLGGGVATVREFLDADLVDTMHVAVAPVELGRGERLWNSPDELLDRFHLETVPSPSGVTHLLFWRR